MKNDLDKLILGFVIGGLISGSSFYLLRASKKDKEMFFKKIRKIIVEVGDLLKKSNFDEENAAFEEIMKNIPKKDNLANFMMLAVIGINLWNKWR